MATPPEVKRVLEQVEAELMAIIVAKGNGAITIHCGRNDIVVEVNRKREVVRLERKTEPVIKQTQ